MKIGGPPAIDPGRLLDQAYRAKTAQSSPEQMARVLDLGTLLKGRVVSIDEAGLLTVATEQGSFKASSASRLEVGREFWFQVIQPGTNPTLAEAGKTNAVLNLLRVLLPEMLTGDGATILAGVDVSQKGKTPELNQDDMRLLRFLAENAIDGKSDPGKLIKLISQLHLGSPSSDKRPGSELTESVSPLLRDIDSPALQKLVRLLESHAAANQQPATSAGSDYFLFPVFFAEQAGRGEWLFSYEQNAGEGDLAGVTAISFYLAMTQLGDIHLTITSHPKALSGVFTLTTEDAASHVRERLPELTEALKPLAGTVVITCRTAQFDSLKALKDDLMAKVGRERFGLVDVKA